MEAKTSTNSRKRSGISSTNTVPLSFLLQNYLQFLVSFDERRKNNDQADLPNTVLVLSTATNASKPKNGVKGNL